MSFLSPEISEHDRMTAEAAEMHRYVDTAVKSRSACGQARAVHGAARDLGMKPRRVIAILRGEIRRVWADELTTARRWYRSHIEHQVRLLEQQAALNKTLLQNWDETWPNG